MVGYRNASLLVLRQGELIKGTSSNLGFSQMIHRVIELTSGQTEEPLIQAICAVGSKEKPDKRIFERLVRTNRTELKQAEVDSLKLAIEDARKEYIMMLTNWLKQQIPLNNIDEFLIGGGTARYLKSEIVETLRPYGAYLNWGQTLELRLKQVFALEVSQNDLAARLADVYGLLYKLLNLPLPRLLEPQENARNQRRKEEEPKSKEVSHVST